MQNAKGSNVKDMKQFNRALVLKHIATKPKISRTDLAEATGLSKMAVGNMVNDLMEMGLVEEIKPAIEGSFYGRPPGVLCISGKSPLICGMLIKREIFQVILADLSGHIVGRNIIPYGKELKKENIAAFLVESFEDLRSRQQRPIVAVGISSVGPVDTQRGIICNPPYFYGINNVEIVKEVKERTGLPTFLVNDANAGALAERLYGSATGEHNFCYLHIATGIGLGCVLDGKLYSGDFGQSGEIGHTSINYMGPKCECGNSGCLEMYANVERLNVRIRELEQAMRRPAPAKNGEALSWEDVVDSANRGDFIALAALEEFCTYISYAMTNIVNLFDFSCIIVGYDAHSDGDAVEQILKDKLQSRVLYSDYRRISVKRSVYGGDAPLIGAIACCAERVFDLSLQLFS